MPTGARCAAGLGQRGTEQADGGVPGRRFLLEVLCALGVAADPFQFGVLTQFDNLVESELDQLGQTAGIGAGPLNLVAAQCHQPFEVITKHRSRRCGKATHLIQSALIFERLPLGARPGRVAGRG